MATIVTTGQITIVDNNDARPITAYIASSQGTQQIYSKDEDTVGFIPSWSSGSPNVLTAYIYVGQTNNSKLLVASDLQNIKWSLSSVDGAALATVSNVRTVSGLTLSLLKNIDPATPNQTYFFQADYTDPITALVSHIIISIQLSLVKTGTNAVYMVMRGQTVIRKSNTTEKAVVAVAVNVVRSVGFDTTNITYKFFKDNGSTQIDTGDAAHFGLKTTLEENQPSGALGDLGVNIPSTNAYSVHNTIVIHEDAVADMEVFRAVAKDSTNTEYQIFFTIHDTADPYDIKIISSNGDKLQNGIGSTVLKPKVYNGGVKLTDTELLAWKFKWYLYASNGVRAGFIDDVRTQSLDGLQINTNTATTITLQVPATVTVAVGDMIKILKDEATSYYYEVRAASSGGVITIGAALISTFLNPGWPVANITSGMFAGCRLFICKGTGTDPGESTVESAGTIVTTGAVEGVTVDGTEIENKGTIVVEAYRP